MIIDSIHKPGWFVEVFPSKGIIDSYVRGKIVRMSEHWVWVEFPGAESGGRPFRRDTGKPVYAYHTAYPHYCIRRLTHNK